MLLAQVMRVEDGDIKGVWTFRSEATANQCTDTSPANCSLATADKHLSDILGREASVENLPADEGEKFLQLTKMLHSGKLTDKALRTAVCKQPSKQV